MGLKNKYEKAVTSGIGLASENPEIAPPKVGNPEAQFKGSNLDLEYKAPAGGPINTPQYNFSHTYLPQPGKRFEDKPEGQIRGPGNFAYDTPISNKSIFHNTDLDLENPAILGGPINVPYTTIIGTEVKSFNTTQPYLPQDGKTYKDSLQNPLLIARATDSFR